MVGTPFFKLSKPVLNVVKLVFSGLCWWFVTFSSQSHSSLSLLFFRLFLCHCLFDWNGPGHSFRHEYQWKLRPVMRFQPVNQPPKLTASEVPTFQLAHQLLRRRQLNLEKLRIKGRSSFQPEMRNANWRKFLSGALGQIKTGMAQNTLPLKSMRSTPVVSLYPPYAPGAWARNA